MLRREFVSKGAAAVALPALASCRAAAPPLARVNIVATSGTTQLVLSALLKQQGYFRELGIVPTFVNVADGNKVVAALVSGAADICPTSGFTQVLAAIEKGAEIGRAHV